MNMSQLKSLANKYRKLKKSKEITFAKWGNSIAVRIPSDYAKEFKIHPGKHGLLTKDEKGIRILPS
jgi:antitoxin component of MazEF toxin-antitoxin module